MPPGPREPDTRSAETHPAGRTRTRIAAAQRGHEGHRHRGVGWTRRRRTEARPGPQGADASTRANREDFARGSPDGDDSAGRSHGRAPARSPGRPRTGPGSRRGSGAAPRAASRWRDHRTRDSAQPPGRTDPALTTRSGTPAAASRPIVAQGEVQPTLSRGMRRARRTASATAAPPAIRLAAVRTPSSCAARPPC